MKHEDATAVETRAKKLRKRLWIWIPLGLILLIGIIFFANSCASIPAGHTGILTTFGKVEDKVLTEGFNWKSPFQKVIKMDNRTQKTTETFQAFSSDIQEVDILLAVNYSINQETAQKLYRTVGTEYYQNIVYPRLLEGTKAIFAEQLISNREILSEQIANIVVPSVSQYGIVVSSIMVQNIDFTDAFTNAVEAKQVAQQNKLTAQTQQDQLTMEANRQVIKAQARIAAQAELEVTKIQADAAEYAGQKEAARNKAIAAWLTSDLLKYYYIQQWDGKLPTYMLGENANILMNPN